MVISFIHFLIMLQRSVRNHETATNFSQLVGQILNMVGNCIKVKIGRKNGMGINSSLKETMVTFTQLNFKEYSGPLLILSAFISNMLNFVMNPGDSLAKIPRGISMVTALFTYI